MLAGGKAGGVGAEQCAGLERYGLHLGVAFQVIDDCLDFEGITEHTGKALFADLREGKLTYPLLVALDRDAGLVDAVGTIIADGDGEIDARAAARVGDSLRGTGALHDARALARERVTAAVDALDVLEPGPARTHLVTVAEATLLREK
jgi:octaprenyl-diphosphate synthase